MVSRRKLALALLPDTNTLSPDQVISKYPRDLKNVSKYPPSPPMTFKKKKPGIRLKIPRAPFSNGPVPRAVRTPPHIDRSRPPCCIS